MSTKKIIFAGDVTIDTRGESVFWLDADSEEDLSRNFGESGIILGVGKLDSRITVRDFRKRSRQALISYFRGEVHVEDIHEFLEQPAYATIWECTDEKGNVSIRCFLDYPSLSPRQNENSETLMFFRGSKKRGIPSKILKNMILERVFYLDSNENYFCGIFLIKSS